MSNLLHATTSTSLYPEAFENLEEKKLDAPQVDVLMPEISDPATLRPRFGRVRRIRVTTTKVAKRPLPSLVLAMERHLDAKMQPSFEYHPRYQSRYHPVDVSEALARFRRAARSLDGERALLSGPRPMRTVMMTPPSPVPSARVRL